MKILWNQVLALGWCFHDWCFIPCCF